MSIDSINLLNFRQFSAAKLTPLRDGFTWIVGNNASGKTSLLEAIHCLSMGRSFRTTLIPPLIKQDEHEFILFAELQEANQVSSSIGIKRSRHNDMELHINGETVSTLSALAPLLPVRAIHSQSHQLFEMGPQFRRKYLDWGLFYQFPDFLKCWRTYEQILKQRNQLLRMQKAYSAEIEPWTVALSNAAEELDSLRKQYVEKLEPYFYAYVQELLPDVPFIMDYSSGWSKFVSFQEALKATFNEECRLGYTVVGPHKADLNLQSLGMPVKQFLSRGQQKLLICAMILAQGSLCFQAVGRQIVYLVDDLTSELDFESSKRLLTVLSQQKAQVFLSAITGDEILKTISTCPAAMKMFHVKHQRLEEQNI